jgi:hypothetical protein
VQLLVAAAAQQPRRLALRRPLLLLLRCLLLAALALALAAPRLPGRAGTAGEDSPRPWLLVEPGLAAVVPPALRAPVGGARPEERWLAPGLPPRDAMREDDAPPADLAAVPGGVWSLLREADALAPATSELRVVSGGRLAALAGERPALSRPVRWHVVPDPRPNRWLAIATRRAEVSAGTPDAEADDGEAPLGPSIVVATSDVERTVFAPPTAGALSGEDPRGVLRLSADDAVPADDALLLATEPRPLRVELLAEDDRGEDARYVAAALAAAAAEAGLPLELRRESVTDRTNATDLAFWLGDADPPAALLAALAPEATLVLDRARPEASCGGSFAVAGTHERVTLRRCAGEERIPAEVALWRSDRGRPLLAVERPARPRTLRLHGRFHPAWSDLVVSPALPAWLLAELTALRSAPSAELPSSDRRADGGQGAPATRAEEPARRRAPRPPADSPAPERALWSALPLLLVIERWLAGRRR